MKIRIHKISLSNLGIFLFLLAMYSIGTISAITVSWKYTLLLLFLSAAFFFFNSFVRKKCFVSYISIAWLIITAVCLVGSIRTGTLTLLAFYLLCAVILVFSQGIEINALNNGIKTLKIFGLFFAAGCYWQYLFPDQYYAWLYPLFGADYQRSIRRQFTINKMCTGFTSQTAVVSEFIVLGLMAVIYCYSLARNRREKRISVIEIIFLLGGLMLTGKRSPILNLGVAFTAVYMLTVKQSKWAKRLI